MQRNQIVTMTRTITGTIRTATNLNDKSMVMVNANPSTNMNIGTPGVGRTIRNISRQIILDLTSLALLNFSHFNLARFT